MGKITLKRIYETPNPEDGYRILVDRLWARGISKEKAQLDEWMKDLGPSTELRKWFNHQDELFPEFQRKYEEELQTKTKELNHIRELLKQKDVCLVFSARNEKHNQAVVLKEVLER